MGLDDLPGKHQSDSGTTLLGGKERNEEVLCLREPGTLVIDLDDDIRANAHASKLHTRPTLHRCLNRIAHEVDQRLFDLIGVDMDTHFVKAGDGDRRPSVQGDNSPDQRRQLHLPPVGGGSRAKDV